MKIKSTLTAVIVTISLLLFSQAVTAATTTSASILYNESFSDGLWQYDYTFANLSTNNEYLYGVQFFFGDQYNIDNTQAGGSWDIISTSSFLGTHSTNYANDIAAEASLSGFSFTVNSQIGDISYAAFFDDHSGNRSYNTGLTDEFSPSNINVVPEPISTVLFLTGGVTMAFRYRQKKRKLLS